MAYVSIHNLLPGQCFPWDPPLVPAYLQYPICMYQYCQQLCLAGRNTGRGKDPDGGVIPKAIITIKGIFLDMIIRECMQRVS